MFMPKFEDIYQVMLSKGYVFFENGDYNLNLIGVRKEQRATDSFDDVLLVAYKIDKMWTVDYFPFTTDPGIRPLENPPSYGRAILVPGQYRGAWQLGLHKGKQEALVQVKPVTVYRDRNCDNNLDYENPQTGLFGINIHWSSTTHTSVRVDNWSEGCQVGCGPENYRKFLELLNTAAYQYGYGPRFTYTLLEEKDFTGVL